MNGEISSRLCRESGGGSASRFGDRSLESVVIQVGSRAQHGRRVCRDIGLQARDAYTCLVDTVDICLSRHDILLGEPLMSARGLDVRGTLIASGLLAHSGGRRVIGAFCVNFPSLYPGM
ncbi:MAG: hypothetical protein KDJ27_15410 [Gammaproteobacteria bacterium]|nr:hypothetical protein [Gammaproteobacteria bacterium]MCB1925105.1 hypothetical protein [Gammaproteobacteria bacterium]